MNKKKVTLQPIDSVNATKYRSI